MKDKKLKIQSELLACGLAAKFDEPMSTHTTIRCGGNAKIYIEPQNFTELKNCIDVLNKNSIKFIIIGNGSNILFKDEGYSGAVICLNKYASYKFFAKKIYADCGMHLKKLSDILLESSLSGFEFAASIPATLGGAIYMNAGCFDSSMDKVVDSVLTYDLKECKLKNNSECGFSYRHSVFQENNEIILGAVLKLNYGDKEEILKKIKDLQKIRKETQPVNFPSSGSVFKRGKDYFPAKLIESCGLKGFSIGGAEVSKLHSGFIINKGSATAKNILSLIDTIKLKVYNIHKIELIEEIKIIGD